MKTLSEMTTKELWTLRDEVGVDIAEQDRRGWPATALRDFWHAIDDELARRGA